jgi:hypothetical protein
MIAFTKKRDARACACDDSQHSTKSQKDNGWMEIVGTGNRVGNVGCLTGPQSDTFLQFRRRDCVVIEKCMPSPVLHYVQDKLREGSRV